MRVQRILATVDSIPRGAVATYGQVAREAGLSGRARLVGRVLSELPSRSALAWHRVVNAAGRISLRRDGRPSAEQRRRLAAEGVRLGAGGRVDLARHGWRPGAPAAATRRRRARSPARPAASAPSP